jgi:hypothetical protein
MSGSPNLNAFLPSSPVVWTDTGELRLEWLAFFRRIWERTGGPVGGAVGTGTITGVTAGAGLAGGGVSGTVTITLTIPVTIPHGGTGATTAAQALVNLGAIPTTADNILVWG